MNSPTPRTLTDYVRAARRHGSIVIVSAIVFGVAACVALKRVPDIYESSASIIIETPPAAEPGRRAAGLRQQARDLARLEEIIVRRGLFRREVEEGERVSDLASQVRAGIGVSEDPNLENQFTISYRAADPATAREITAELAGQLVAENRKAATAQSTGDDTDQPRRRAAELSSQLHQLEVKAPWLLAINEAGPIAPTPSVPRIPQDVARAQQMTIESLKDRQYLIQQQLADLERRVTAQRHVIEQQKKTSTLRDNPTYALLISKRAELQGQRDTLINRQELTDKHPRVTAITDQITAINRQIEELRQQDVDQVGQSPEARELGALESERNRLKLELEINNREMARRMSNPPAQGASQASAIIPARRGASSGLAQQYLSLRREHEELMARVREADSKRRPAPGAQPEQSRLVEQATLPREPISPDRWLLMLAAAATGLAAGACFAVLAGSRGLSSLQDARDVERYARVPLLASIPKSLTAEEQNLAARRAKIRLALCAAAAAAATLALSQIFIVTRIFSLLSEK
jgi:capsular polysaccharide biosynthesis protein